MTDNQQWQAANQARAALYRWFADVFASEFTKQNLADLKEQYPSLHEAFVNLGLDAQSSRLQKALNDLKVIPKDEQALEVAADFAHIFLLSGIESAPPYASYYLESDQMLYGKPAQQMGEFLKHQKLALHPEFKEPKDHISIYLQVMALWIQNDHKDTADTDSSTVSSNAVSNNAVSNKASEQKEFLQDALLTWLPMFNRRCQIIRVKTDVYPALTELLLHFVEADAQALADIDLK